MSEVEQADYDTPQEWIEARKVIDLKLESIREYIELAIQDVKEYHKLDPNWYVGLEDSLKFAQRVTSQYQNFKDELRPVAIYDEETYKQDCEQVEATDKAIPAGTKNVAHDLVEVIKRAIKDNIDSASRTPEYLHCHAEYLNALVSAYRTFN